MVPFSCVNLSCSVFTPVAAVVSAPLNGFLQLVNRVVRGILHSSFYMGYQVLPADVVREREQNLASTYGAQVLECRNAQGKPIDVRYLPSPADRKTNNVLVICLNTTYVDHHPRHYTRFLENGGDVVLWNPTQVTPHAYQEDLVCVLRTLHEQRPEQRIAIKSYCASSDPAIGAAACVQFPVSLIVDRGHGDVFSLTRSNTRVAEWDCVKQVLREEYDCGGRDKIGSLQGRVLLLTPEVDQVMNFDGRNFTRELHERAPQSALENIPGDHWAKWGRTAYTKVLSFLQQEGILASSQPVNIPDPSPPTFWDRTIMPWLIKSWC